MTGSDFFTAIYNLTEVQLPILNSPFVWCPIACLVGVFIVHFVRYIFEGFAHD